MSWKRLEAVLSCRVGCGLSARLSSHLLLSSQPSQGFLCSLLQLPFAPSRMMVVVIGLAGRHLNNCVCGGDESLCNKQLLLTKKKNKKQFTDQLCKSAGSAERQVSRVILQEVSVKCSRGKSGSDREDASRWRKSGIGQESSTRRMFTSFLRRGSSAWRLFFTLRWAL